MKNLILFGLAGLGAYCLYKGYLKKELQGNLQLEDVEDKVKLIIPEKTSAASGDKGKFLYAKSGKDGLTCHCQCPQGHTIQVMGNGNCKGACEGTSFTARCGGTSSKANNGKKLGHKKMALGNPKFI